MIETSFTLYKDGKAHTVTSSELFSSRRVLLCSVIRPVEFVTHHYIKHLADQKIKYQQHGIDLLLYTSQPWTAATIDSYFPDLEVILDRDRELLSWLSEEQNKTKPISWLSRFWLFQVLINNRNLEYFVEQPTENRMEDLRRRLNTVNFKELLELKNGQGFWYLKRYLTEDEELVFDRECFFEFGNEYMLYNLLFFSYVWPNKSLMHYLTETTK